MDNKNAQQLASIWPASFTKTLPATSFLFTEENGVKHFAYKDAEGNISATNLKHAFISIPKSTLEAKTKTRTLEKARLIAKGIGINLSEEFVDEVNLKGPLFMPYLPVTIEEFNSGELLGEVTQEEYDYIGRRLVTSLNKSITTSISRCTYDADGNIVFDAYDSETESESEWVYQDGQVVRTKSTSGWNNATETEYDVVDNAGEDESFMESTLHAGDTVKMLRSKKKWSRYNMAAKMKITADRLKEIEESGEYTGDEIEEIASALGTTRKRIERMSQYMSFDEGYEVEKAQEQFYEIVSEGSNEQAKNEKVAEARGEQKAIQLYESFEERALESFGGKTKKTHRLSGLILMEEVKEDGTIKFEVPLFKIGQYTANGNRYMKEFAENLIEDIRRLRESRSQSDYSSAKRSVLDIDVYEDVPDMQATHDPRIGKGNDILACAGEVLGGKIGEVDGDPTFILFGETIPTNAGKDVTVQIKRQMIRGVSHVTVPTKYEENSKNGYDVFRGHIVGADFTKNPANAVQFQNRTTSGFEILN